MQRLVRSVSLLWAASPQVSAGAAERLSLSLPAMAVSVASVAPPFDPHQDVKVHFPAPSSRWADWTEEFVDVALRLDADHLDGNHSALGLAVVAYRNLSKLLPERLVIKQQNDEELEMEINSRVVSVWLGSPSGAVVAEPPEGFVADAWLRAIVGTGDEGQRVQSADGDLNGSSPRPGWVEVCGLTSEVGATYTGAWDLTACVLEHPAPGRCQPLGGGGGDCGGGGGRAVHRPPRARAARQPQPLHLQPARHHRAPARLADREGAGGRGRAAAAGRGGRVRLLPAAVAGHAGAAAAAVPPARAAARPLPQAAVLHRHRGRHGRVPARGPPPAAAGTVTPQHRGAAQSSAAPPRAVSALHSCRWG
ncbi:hypothetical protein ONE63_000281 [Megalurothrips usitatus]|uniref:Uncharacterized protein n=1 Tax=Megalurothrips usitatus TaxID=439358 RepID=A0AAV7Y1U5_9NEOP|nr:hypothetical protein ONE63_000281 [Megalurothrips usitatus]